MTEPRFYTVEVSGFLTPKGWRDPGVTVHVFDRFTSYMATFRSERQTQHTGKSGGRVSHARAVELARERAAEWCAELNAKDEALCA